MTFRRKMPGHAGERGFALLPVVLAVLSIAAVAMLVSGESAMETRLRADEFDRDIADLAARGATEQALWLYDGLGCAGYPDITSGTLGNAAYGVTVSPTTGSPVTLTATATIGNDTAAVVSFSDQPVYDVATDTLTLQPGAEGKDNFVRQDKANFNYGTTASIFTQESAFAARHGLIEFDLSTFPPAARLVSAVLTMRVTGSTTPGDVFAYPIVRDWVEGTKSGKAENTSSNWDQPHGYLNWLTEGGDFEPTIIDTASAGAAGSWISWDITSVTNDWLAGRLPNNGILLVADTGTNVNYASSDASTPGNHPALALTYVCECGQGC
jgi:hypothetical protein